MPDEPKATSTLDRLRRLQGLRSRRAREERELTGLAEDALPGDPGPAGPLEQLIPGRTVENDLGSCFLVEERIPLETVRGVRPLGALLGREARGLDLPEEFDFRAAAFLDTETTGLGNGAGVFAFMVGVGAFEEGPGGQEFVVRQFFTRHPGEEPALLHAVAELLAGRQGLVTFNGRTFDAPLLRNRYRLNRHLLPSQHEAPRLLQPAAPHLDLLPPARRLWRKRLESCALGSLERAILDHQRREEDVPGRLIPQLYQHFLITGQAGAMRRVFYHNREDIVSMVALAETICRHFAAPHASAERGEIAEAELAGLGRLYEEQGKLQEAERAYRRALELGREPALLADVFFRLGRLLKRQARWQEAGEIWQRWITTVPGPDPRPYVELAKFCEWQTGDLEQAAMWTSWALHNLQSGPSHQRSLVQLAELEHRLARIQRKLGSQTGPG